MKRNSIVPTNVSSPEYENLYAAIALPRGQEDTFATAFARVSDVNVVFIGDVTKPYFNRTPLFFAVEKGNYAAVRRLLDRAADVNCQGPMGNTPLHVAAKANDRKMAEMLVRRGADLHALNDFERTPQDIASSLPASSFGDMLVPPVVVAPAATPFAARFRLHTPSLLSR